MLNVPNDALMLSVIMLNVANDAFMLSVIMLSVVAPFFSPPTPTPTKNGDEGWSKKNFDLQFFLFLFFRQNGPKMRRQN
jgi:hypothetical protein